MTVTPLVVWLAALLAVQQTPGRTIWDGVYTSDQAKRGDVLYQGMCAGCHGAALDGMDTAPALAGGAFMVQWDGVTLADMAERIRKTMPIDRPGALARQQVVDVLAYILSYNGVPAGDAELPPEAGALRAIRFAATKP
jgi:mono/diheme cytochrome c family protein